MLLKKILVSLFSLLPVVFALPQLNAGQYLPFHQELCLDQFYAQAAPELINQKLAVNNYPLCNQGFSLNYSGVSKTPIWVAEKLTPERLSIRIKREDNFHEDSRLPVSVQATLDDYRGSGYDRGHMAPNADMNNKNSQYQSFALSNIVPQASDNNQNTWREIEEATRAMVSKYKLDGYIITGPAYLEPTVRYVKKGHDVLVPSHVFKAIYFPRIGLASAYLSPNDSTRQAQVMSICALEEKIGINLFPRVDEQSKRQVYQLPRRANQVKAKKHPQYLNTDMHSQCAPTVEAEQILATQKTFIKNQSYDNQLTNLKNIDLKSLDLKTLEKMVSEGKLSHEVIEQLPSSQKESRQEYGVSMNKWLLAVIRWLKLNNSQE